MARYSIDCHDPHCDAELWATNDPREAYDIAHRTADAGHQSEVTARGLVNRFRYDRANRDR